MKDFLVQENDLKIKNGDLAIINGDDVILQEIDRVLSTRKGEWFLNRQLGMDYSELEKKHSDEELIKIYILEAIWQVDGVKEVFDLKLHFNHIKRAFKISFQIVLKGEENGRNYEIWI